MFSDMFYRQTAHFMFNNFFSRKRAVCEIMWQKDGTARQATDGSVMQRREGAVCMRGN